MPVYMYICRCKDIQYICVYTKENMMICNYVNFRITVRKCITLKMCKHVNNCKKSIYMQSCFKSEYVLSM